MSVFFNTTEAIVYQGNCLEELKNLDDNSVDAVVTDPPYGLANIDAKVFTAAILKWVAGDRAYMPSGKGFMNKSWDAFVPPPAVWDECFRVLKPGGHILVFAGSRTVDLMGISIRMAGFEIRDSIAWIYGSGFPKSYNVAKGIESVLTNGSASWNDFHTLNGTLEEANGNANGMVKKNAEQGARPTEYESHGKLTLDPTTEEAKKWQGWGTALKPAIEPIIMARKPLGEKNVASNVLKHGTGAINIDASRIGSETVIINTFDNGAKPWGDAAGEPFTSRESEGRFPSNVIFQHTEECVQVGETSEKTLNHNAPTGTFAGGEQDRGSDTSEYRENNIVTPIYNCVDGCPVKELDKQTGKTKSGKPRADRGTGGIWSEGNGVPVGPQYGDEGGASRFFYQAKASKKDRNEGLENLPEKAAGSLNMRTDAHSIANDMNTQPRANFHPTVKPTALMEYLIKLITPVGGTVLDPFTGSGSTGKAAIRNGFNFVGVEMTEEYLPIIQARLEHEINQKGLF
jgi:site-specific DNA-methyltransferase (adenine-specific)